MHELPLTQSLLQIALDHGSKVNAHRITDLHIVMGELASMMDDSIQFYWAIIAKDTIAENAMLHFRREPAEFQCINCFETYHPTRKELACPKCNGAGARITKGEELVLESIEVE